MSKPEKLAGFVAYQWIQLDWPVPDAILGLPDDASWALSKAVAPLLCRPWVKLEEIQEIDLTLLYIDAGCPNDFARQAIMPAYETCPKTIYQLSLTAYNYGGRHGARNRLD